MDHQLIAKEWSRLLDEFFATRGDAYRRAVEACVGALKNGRKILAFGNGGSAAEAQHFAAGLVNKFLKPRPALRAVTLSSDTSVLTCIGNDISYDAVFSRQIEALGDLGDVALGLTTSGNSPNVIEALKTSKEQGLVTIVLTGWSGGKSAPLADFLLDVPSSETPRIQEIHLFLLHLLAGDIEERMFPGH